MNDPTPYELSTGFHYDDINSKITVFDGDYNNLINKPILGTIPDINTDHVVQNITATNKFVVSNTYNNNLTVNGNLTIIHQNVRSSLHSSYTTFHRG